MNNSFFQNLIDIISLTVLLTLSAYHLIVYWRRKKYAEEQYNLYFASFTAFVALYLFFESPMFVLKIFTENIYGDWIPPAEGLTVLGIFFSFTRFFSRMVNLPLKQQKYLKLSLLYLTLSLSLTLSSLIKGWNWFNQHTNNIVVVLTAIFIFFIIYIYGRWIYENKLYRNKNLKLIIIGICILIFYLLSAKLTEIIFYPATVRGNNFIIVGVVFLFAYALAEKFNNEYDELVLLKTNLEQKILDRTAELTKAKDQIEKDKEEIEKVSKERSDFFINLAHETKTPLTIISNYLERYINKNGLSEEIGIIKANIDKLCKDMVDFLDMEKLIKGHFNFENNQVTSFSGLLTEKKSMFGEYARNKNIQLSINAKDNICIKADPYLVDRIIFNLVENAIKYTNTAGEVNVTLANENGNKNILFVVNDKGPGIPEAKIPFIFDPYYQVSHPKFNTQGIGMGLYIVKSSVELLQGSISVESIENKGTTFTVKLPSYIPNENENIVSSVPVKHIPDSKVIEKSFDSQKKSILVVEDNIEMLNYLVEELSNEYNIFPAGNGVEAINKISKIPLPAVIISDMMMDNMDGEELFTNILANDSFKNIPFIFLTAKTQQEQKIKMLESGAVDYIYKPFSISELKARVKTTIENRERQNKAGLKQAMEVISRQINNPDNLVSDKQIIFEERCRQFDLTARQKEIANIIAEGLEYKEIADRLNVAPKTIMNHIDILFKKLNVHSKIDLLNKLYR